MFDTMMQSNEVISQSGNLYYKPDMHYLRCVSASLFNRMHSNAKMSHFWKRILHRPNRVPSLSDLQSKFKLISSHDNGLKPVKLDQIIGSVNRCEDFDSAFKPLKECTEQRWNRIAVLFFKGEELPPVDLIQVSGSYYVRDGHHRISVARALGRKFIDAQVTEMQFGVDS